MATGISKNRWDEEDKVIFRDSLEYVESNYELNYKGKLNKDAILNSSAEAKYISIFNNSDKNSLFFGDNFDVLKHLVHGHNLRGKVNLVYIDPPYGTNSVFHSRENINSYSDTLTGAYYIEFIRKRLILLHELLSKDGSIFIHLDNNMIFQTKIIMDEVFGSRNFRGFITRKKCSNKNSTKTTFGNISDYILFYSKTDKYKWNRPTESWPEEKIAIEYNNIDAITGKRFKKVPIHAPGIRNGETGKPWRGMLPPPGKHWQFTPAKLDELDKNGEIYWSSNGNPRRKIYFDEIKGIAVQDIWLDVQDSLNQSIKITGYPTEKNPDLIKRIIEATTDKNDTVLDCFVGSGTTLDVSKSLERNWIGVDNSIEAIDHILKRFIEGTKEMGDYVNKNSNKENLLTLFESLSQYDNKSAKLNFQFFVDSDFIEFAKKLILKWDISKISSFNHSIATDYLKTKDPVLSQIIEDVGPCKLKEQESNFLFLVEAIISQQLSLKASESIIKRLKDYYKDQITAQDLLKEPDRKLESLGISSRKISYLKDLATKIVSKELLLNELKHLSNEEVIQKLTTVKGIGLWTTKMFLIFVLSREDVLPIEDTAFKNKFLMAYKIHENKYNKEVANKQQLWHPYESIASWYLWASNI